MTADTIIILEWRREQLARVGFSETEAVLLAERTDVDLHAAVDLVRRGCPPALATRILL